MAGPFVDHDPDVPGAGVRHAALVAPCVPEPLPSDLHHSPFGAETQRVDPPVARSHPQRERDLPEVRDVVVQPDRLPIHLDRRTMGFAEPRGERPAGIGLRVARARRFLAQDVHHS